MTESDINDLQPNVRSRFRDLRDEQFFDHPEVAALRARLDELEAQHRETAAAHHKLSTQLSGLGKQQEWARAEAVRLADGRPRRLAEIFLGGDADLAQDRAVLAEIANLHHFVAAVDLARPHIEKTIRQASQETSLVVSNMNGVQDAHRGLLDQLKLAEAQRLAA